MISLPHGCWISDPTVNPSNWKQVGASTSKDWYIQYYFHDPSLPNDHKYKKGKLCIVKGMNKFKTVTERRDMTSTLMNDEIDALNDGFNPITRMINPVVEEDLTNQEIDPRTPFMQALKIAQASLTCVKTTKADIKSVLKYTEIHARKLQYHGLPIAEIKKKHIKKIMVSLSLSKEVWNENQFNYYRKYLGMLFKELMEYVDLEYNPAIALKKKETVKKMRLELTAEERIKVDKHLREVDHYFWRFTNLFYHSGARETEFMKIKKSDVDIKEQMHLVTILKGKKPHQAWKPIKDIVLDLWKEVLGEAGNDQYLFSKYLKPGNVPINPRQVTRRWNRHVKNKLGIQADFYSLKHSNLDEIEAELSLQEAQKNADHSTPVITMNVYTKGAAKRKLKRLIKAKNAFA
jgi:integrase